MTELEYTIAAATAAGYQWQTAKHPGEKIVVVLQDHQEDGFLYFEGWNPLDDDRDALDLAARLSIVVQDTAEGAIATCIDIPGTEGIGFLVGTDRPSARRFAIVQCAASAARGAAA